tara:strand:+ start:1292 stop:2023 length:732 start_codon:yes stop_codon:yes gene_type:complete
MSKQNIDINASVSVNLDAASNVHTLRQLTEMGLTLDGVSQKVRTATTSMAEHYYEHALKCERDARAKQGTVFVAAGKAGTAEFTSKNADDQETIRLALAMFRAKVNEELAWLKANKGWEKDKMPGACDQAIRKIYAGWENNFSLEVLKSVSKVSKANADRTKEKDAELLSQAGVPTGTTESDASGMELQCSPEHHAAILKAVAALDAAFQANTHQATSQVEAVVSRCDNIVKHAAAQLARKAS